MRPSKFSGGNKLSTLVVHFLFTYLTLFLCTTFLSGLFRKVPTSDGYSFDFAPSSSNEIFSSFKFLQFHLLFITILAKLLCGKVHFCPLHRPFFVLCSECSAHPQPVDSHKMSNILRHSEHQRGNEKLSYCPVPDCSTLFTVQ